MELNIFTPKQTLIGIALLILGIFMMPSCESEEERVERLNSEFCEEVAEYLGPELELDSRLKEDYSVDYVYEAFYEEPYNVNLGASGPIRKVEYALTRLGVERHSDIYESYDGGINFNYWKATKDDMSCGISVSTVRSIEGLVIGVTYEGE